jgi:hypothetical protein
MINIEDEMRGLIDNCLADGAPCMVGTASRDGYPQISIKGSVLVYDQESLAYWERSKRSALENVGENPNVVILYRNRDKRINWRFYGTATIHEVDAVREDVMSRTVQAELDRDPDRQGVAVVVRLNQIAELSGNVLQSRD